MSIGVLFTQGQVTGEPRTVLSEILEQAEAADRLGFSAALTTEHKDSEEYFGAPLHLAFAIAARTRRVRVGTAIAIAPLYPPVVLAQDAAMLDQLSGGRAWLGLGAGYMPVDYAAAGVPWDDRAQRFDETVRILRAAHTQERFSFADELYRFDDLAVLPRPFRPDGVPLHLAAWTPGGLRRAGRLGDGWITNALMALPTMAGLAADYRAAAEAAGRRPHITAIRFCCPTRPGRARSNGSATPPSRWRAPCSTTGRSPTCPGRRPPRTSPSRGSCGTGSCSARPPSASRRSSGSGTRWAWTTSS